MMYLSNSLIFQLRQRSRRAFYLLLLFLLVAPVFRASAQTLIGSVATPAHPGRIAFSGNYAYLPCYEETSLAVVDIRDPSDMRLVNTASELGGGGEGVAVSGNYLYWVGDSAPLGILDISDPVAPRIIRQVPLASGRARWLEISGNYAYVLTHEESQLEIVDISDPSAAAVVSRIGTAPLPMGLKVADHFVYVVSRTGSLQVFDITSPNTPELVAALSLGGEPEDMAISGNYVYVVNRTANSLQVIDIKNRAAPQPELINTVHTSADPLSISHSGSILCVTTGASRSLLIFSLCDPALPALVSMADTVTDERYGLVRGEYVYTSVHYTAALLKSYRIDNIPCSNRLTISNVRAEANGSTSVTIRWDTNRPADSYVEYGFGRPYDHSQSEAAMVTSHQIELTGLMRGVLYRYRVRSSDGSEMVYSEDYAFCLPSDSHGTIFLSGTVTLESSFNQEQRILFEFRPLDTSVEAFVIPVYLGATGSYLQLCVPRRNYTLAIKGSKWLRKTLPIVSPAVGDLNSVDVFLLTGDANDDNSVDVLDLDALIQAFDTVPGDPNWNNGVADFNCDSSVDVLDLDILLRNFDRQGEP